MWQNVIRFHDQYIRSKRKLAEVSGCGNGGMNFFNCLEFSLYKNSKLFRKTRNCSEHIKTSLFQVIL